jgi:hypothetical protein
MHLPTAIIVPLYGRSVTARNNKANGTISHGHFSLLPAVNPVLVERYLKWHII